MDIEWRLNKFDELSAGDLYRILQLRSQVFVVEQQCVYLDTDDKDQACYHLAGLFENRLLAYTRIVPPGVIYEEASIGRVVTAFTVRRSGMGKLLMEHSIKAVYSLFGKVPVKIGAQFYLREFYESFGFKQTSAIYLEDNIEHIYMIL